MQIIEIEKQEIDKERAALRLKEEEIRREQATLKLQWQQLENGQKEGMKDAGRQSREIEVHNDYTIRTAKREDYDKIKMKCEEQQRRC